MNATNTMPGTYKLLKILSNTSFSGQGLEMRHITENSKVYVCDKGGLCYHFINMLQEE